MFPWTKFEDQQIWSNSSRDTAKHFFSGVGESFVDGSNGAVKLSSNAIGRKNL